MEIRSFVDIDFIRHSYTDSWVLYQSSEDPDLLYKGYLEDILFGMQLQGAKLIPTLEFFRAHHNKVFMEVLRNVRGPKRIQNIRAWTFGTLEEFLLKKVLF